MLLTTHNVIFYSRIIETEVGVSILIFLGAGASKPFGIKTMQDLTEDLVKQMRDKGHGETIDNIVKSLKQFNLTPDFESIYTILEALVNPEQGIRYGGPFTAFVAYISKGIGQIKAHPEFEETLRDFRSLIYNACTMQSGVIEKNRRIYDQLFEIEAQIPGGRGEVRRLSPSVGYSGETSTNVPIVNTIVTTNYDMSIELYHRLISFPLADGFSPTPDYFVKQMDLASYTRAPRVGFAGRWLIKLHGSIWQFKQGNRIIKTIEDPKKSSLDIKIDEEMLIYPIGEKPMLRNPYYSFYKIFKEQEWLRMVAIGYSFRDEPVNIAIAENLEKAKGATLIVLNPDPEKVLQNFGSAASTFDDSIIRVSGKFGDEKVFERLKEAVNVVGWQHYQRRIWERFKERVGKSP